MGLLDRSKAEQTNERETPNLTEEEQEQLVEEAAGDLGLDPDKEITGEDINRIVQRLVQEAGLSDEIGFVMFDHAQYDIILQTPDVIVVGRPHDPGRGVRMPHAAELMERLRAASKNGAEPTGPSGEEETE